MLKVAIVHLIGLSTKGKLVYNCSLERRILFPYRFTMQCLPLSIKPNRTGLLVELLNAIVNILLVSIYLVRIANLEY